MFDFYSTNKPVVLFIPNFGRGKYIRALKEQFNTKADRSDYLIVIGNDGIEEDFSDLADLNVSSFTINRIPTERNGAFIRNYFIKNSRCQYLYQKDPEILISGVDDPILEMVETAKKCPDFVIRPKFTASIDQKTTDHVFDIGTTKWFLPQMDDIKEIPIDSPERIHFLYGAPLKLLQDMRGYSEDFWAYGPEDRDMYKRLLQTKTVVAQMQKWLVTHFWHPVSEVVYKNLNEMHLVEGLQDRDSVYRNLNKKWGLG